MIKLTARLTIRNVWTGLVTAKISSRPEGMQAKTVTPGASEKVVTPDGSFKGMYKVTVKATPLQAKTVEPKGAQQIVTPDAGYVGLSSLTVKGAPLQRKATAPYLNGSGTATEKQIITPDAGYYGLSAVEVGPLQMQIKRVEPNAAGQIVEADEGLHGLGLAILSGDAALLPENIKKGVTIFGVTGTYVPEPKDEGGDGTGGSGGSGGTTAFTYKYNGVQLPPLPDWDKTTYPNALLALVGGSEYRLYCSAETPVAAGYGKLEALVIPAPCIVSTKGTASFGTFAAPSSKDLTITGDAILTGSNFKAIWTNTDITFSASGTVFLKASDPVPVT
jgi:hypothetical protein